MTKMLEYCIKNGKDAARNEESFANNIVGNLLSNFVELYRAIFNKKYEDAKQEIRKEELIVRPTS